MNSSSKLNENYYFLQIAAKINQPGQGGSGDGITPGKRPLDADPNNFGEYLHCAH